MKTNLLKTIATVIFSGCFSFIIHAQNVNGKIWVRIENQKIVPTLNLVSGNLESSDSEFNSLIQNLNVVSVEKALPSSRKASLLNVYEISSNSTSVDLYTAAVNSVKSFSAIEYAPEYNVLYVPNDTLQYYPNYSMDLINAYDAWDITHGSSNVVIGISDQNFEVNHEELAGKVTYYDATNTALSTHGTAVAMIAAGNTDNAVGLHSIGFNSKLALFRMTYNDMLNATYNHGVKILNLSWTSGCAFSQIAQDVVTEVYDNGTFIVASAGNGTTCGGASNLVYPASYDNVFSVTSIGASDNHEKVIGDPNSTHQHNSKVDLCAPGYQVSLSPATGWYTNLSSGTSFVAPYVSGTVGLMLAVNPCLTNQDIESILKASAFNLDLINPSYVGLIGAGRLDAFEAVSMASQLDKLMINASVGIACTADGGNISLNASMGTSPYTANWHNGMTGMTVNGLSAGSYSVTITDAQGCSADSTFTIVASTPLLTNSTVQDVSCNGLNDGSIDLTVISGNPAFTFVWDTGASTEDVSNLSAGTYRLTLIDGDGCIHYSSYNVYEPLELEGLLTQVDPNSSVLGSIDLTVTGGTAAYSYAWNNGDVTEDVTGLTAGYYEVTVTDANGCQVILDTDLQQTSLATIGELTEGDVKLYPNPAQSNATISWGGNNITSLMIVNVNGQVVSNDDVSMTNTYGISNLSSGVYMINLITNNNERMTKKFIVL
jgi:hypothetical protein